MNKTFALLVWGFFVLLASCHSKVSNEEVISVSKFDSTAIATNPLESYNSDSAKAKSIYKDKSIEVKDNDRIEFQKYSLIITPAKASLS